MAHSQHDRLNELRLKGDGGIANDLEVEELLKLERKVSWLLL
jgi:hypothetical protein